MGFELPTGYSVHNQYKWTGEAGMIGGEVVKLTTIVPDDPHGERSADALCGLLAGNARIQHDPHKVPADWETCSFETTEALVMVGTVDRFAFRKSLAADACGRDACPEDALITWIQPIG